VIPPERAVPVSSFLTGLRRRGLRVTMRPGKVD
jgi:hypothetical protein